MARVCSIFALLFAFVVMVSAARADDPAPPKKHQHQTPEARFDALEKAASHDPVKGVLTKDEFVTALKTVAPKMADKAEEIFAKITKADEGKVTKDEYVTWAKAQHHGKKKAA